MENTARLYALTSTVLLPFGGQYAGAQCLVAAPALAARWYLQHEREERCRVTATVSSDGGATWHDLLPHELFDAAHRDLADLRRPTSDDEVSVTRGRAGALEWAMALAVQEWAEARISFTQPADPAPDADSVASERGWRRGGQAWALATGTVPDETALSLLATRYGTAPGNGPALLREEARRTLAALHAAADPDSQDTATLLHAAGHLHPQLLADGTTQLHDHARRVHDALVDQLVHRFPEASRAAAAFPEPDHPAHRAARAYVGQLALLHDTPGMKYRVQASDDYYKALDTALQQHDMPHPPTSPVPGSEQPAVVPGFPRTVDNDAQAAAQWRLLSPAAHRQAAEAMNRLEVTVVAGMPDHEGLRSQEQHAEQDIQELNAHHALLLHASLLADAEAAAEQARRNAIVSLHEEFEHQLGGWNPQRQDSYMARLRAVEDEIGQVLLQQRQLTRDALHRLSPLTKSRRGLDSLRGSVLLRAGLDQPSYDNAWAEQARRAQEFDRTQMQQLAQKRGEVRGIKRRVTPSDVETARAQADQARTRCDALRSSSAPTHRALAVLSGVVSLSVTGTDQAVELAARITQSRTHREQAHPRVSSRAAALAQPHPSSAVPAAVSARHR
ncbi:hypothetical protein [Streptomyces sp. NPDC055140]